MSHIPYSQYGDPGSIQPPPLDQQTDDRDAHGRLVVGPPTPNDRRHPPPGPPHVPVDLMNHLPYQQYGNPTTLPPPQPDHAADDRDARSRIGGPLIANDKGYIAPGPQHAPQDLMNHMPSHNYYDPAAISPPQQEAPAEDTIPDHTLEIRQQPEHARVAIGKEKDRKPIDPPPIIQLKVSPKKDPLQSYLQSPYFFMTTAIIKIDDTQETPPPNTLLGTVVSSLHRLKDTDNQDGGFFVFGDLSVKTEGKYKLLFTLFQMRSGRCDHVTHIQSNTFEVYAAKAFPGLAESTFLTRSFSDQGVRLRLRKDSRSMTTRKRNQSAAEMARKHHHGGHGVKREAGGRGDDPGMAGQGGYPGVYDAQPNYPYDDGMGHHKRRRMGGYRDDGGYGGGGGHDAGVGVGVGVGVPSFAPRSSYGGPMQPGPGGMQSVTSSPYQMQSQAPAPLQQYGHHPMGGHGGYLGANGFPGGRSGLGLNHHEGGPV